MQKIPRHESASDLFIVRHSVPTFSDEVDVSRLSWRTEPKSCGKRLACDATLHTVLSWDLKLRERVSS
jgi:hypothetical protein